MRLIVLSIKAVSPLDRLVTNIYFNNKGIFFDIGIHGRLKKWKLLSSCVQIAISRCLKLTLKLDVLNISARPCIIL